MLFILQDKDHPHDPVEPFLSLMPKRQLSVVNLSCPKERLEFYKTFSLLINMGNSQKKESKTLNRQLSSEQQSMQNQYKDLLWLELRAWHANKTMLEKDADLLIARK